MPYLVWRCRWGQIALFFALDALLVCNLMYSRTYYGMIPAESYLLAGNLADFGPSVLDSLRWLDIFFPLSTIAIWIYYCKRKNTSSDSRKPYFTWLLSLLCASFLINLCHGGFKAYVRHTIDCNYHAARPHAFTVFGCIAYDLVSTHEKLTPQMQAEVADFINSTPELPAIDGTRKNYVWILCESLESWVLGTEFEGKEITPYLNSLLADSTTLYLPNVQSQVADGRSIDCQLIENAGLLPLKSGAYSLIAPDNKFYTLADAMSQLKGARSYLFTVDKPNTWNQGRIARAFGIDTMLTRSDWRMDQKIGTRNRLGDESFLRQLTQKCRDGEVWPVGETAFLQVVTYSGHNPWKLPEEYDKLKLTGTYPDIMRQYMTMAHFTDRSLRTFIEYIKSRPDFDSTLVVITGDHEGLADHRKPIVDGLKDNDISSKIAQQHVPVIILNAPASGRIERAVGQIDLYPALLQMLGLTEYRWHGVGRSFLTDETVSFAVDNKGRILGDTIGVPASAVSRAQKARTVSDHILRHNLFDTHK